MRNPNALLGRTDCRVVHVNFLACTGRLLCNLRPCHMQDFFLVHSVVLSWPTVIQTSFTYTLSQSRKTQGVWKICSEWSRNAFWNYPIDEWNSDKEFILVIVIGLSQYTYYRWHLSTIEAFRLLVKGHAQIFVVLRVELQEESKLGITPVERHHICFQWYHFPSFG